MLSEIIDLVNTRCGITLTDDDRVNLESVRQNIDDEEIKKYEWSKLSTKQRRFYEKTI